MVKTISWPAFSLLDETCPGSASPLEEMLIDGVAFPPSVDLVTESTTSLPDL